MRKSLTLCIADIHFKIVVQDEHLLDRLKKHYASYLADGAADFLVAIHGQAADFSRRRLTIRHPVEIEPQSKDRLTILKRRIKGAPYYLGFIETASRMCEVHLKDLNCYSTLLAVIRITFQYFLEMNSGFLLHSTAGRVGEYTYVFTGKSGAGKTTALMNLEADEIVSGDVSAVRVYEEHATIHAIPFRKEISSSGAVRAVFFPRKNPAKPYTHPAHPALSVQEIVSNALFASPNNADLVEPAMNNIMKFCAVIPCFDLYFPKEGSIRQAVVR